ncbi:MAG: hypothetical protein HYV99_01305 [Betaproteobacteria bacterium]|nr:hypothetical protein [Betaproteobacteria bacterium]
MDLATNRLVFTLSDPWPSGFLTGYEADGGFVLEHVVSFKGDITIPLLVAGITEARARHYAHIRIRLPLAFPRTPYLRGLADRMGFTLYHEDEQWIDYVMYL